MRTASLPRRALTAAAIALLTTVALTATPAAAASPDVVLSEVYGGGGNSGGQYHNDFVELYNRGGGSVSLSGWSVQYASASGTTWLVTSLTGSIAAGRKYLVQLAAGTGGGATLPTPDATGTTNMSATAGKVALVTSTSALTCGATCHAATGVRDFLGYGSANDFEGSAAPALSNTTSATRTNPATDTDDNATNFAAAAPTPENSSSGGDTCNYPSTRIRQIQGAAHLSPMSGSVSGVRGVVTAKSGTGFWFQDPCPDTDPATSEGLFVYTASAPSVAVGDEVSVNGTISEFRSGGTATANLTTTARSVAAHA